MSKHVIAAFFAAAIVAIFATAGCGDDTGCSKAEDCAELTCDGQAFRGCINGDCITDCGGNT